MTTGEPRKAGDTLAGVLGNAAERTRESLQGPWIPRDVAPRRFWAWAVILGVSVHALWWVWLIPAGRVSAKPHAPAARVVFLPAGSEPGTETARSRDVRSTWAPALFALPSVDGFSRPMLQQELALRPPLDVPHAGAVYLPRGRTGPRPYLSEGVALTELVGEALAALPREAPLVPAFKPLDIVPAEPTVYVQLSAEFGTSSPFVVGLAGLDNLPGHAPWEVTAYLALDESGQAEHAFLETQTDSKRWNSLIVRGLHRFAFGREHAGQSGRAVVRFPGWVENVRETGEGAGRD